jgi:outer membrane protein
MHYIHSKLGSKLICTLLLVVNIAISLPAQTTQPRPRTPEVRNPDPTLPPGQTVPGPRTPPAETPTDRPSTLPTERPSTISPQTDGASTTINPPATINAPTTEDAPLPEYQPKPVPPVPSLHRLGIESGKEISLSLKDAIRLALENNNDIEVARDDVRIAEYTLRSLEGVYDPVLSFSPEITNTVSPVTSVFAGSTQPKNTSLNFNSTVSKSFGFGGGRYDLFFNNAKEKSNSSFQQLNPYYRADFGLQFTQPILRNRSIDRNRREIRVQRKRLQQSDADFRRLTIDVIAQVQRAYWDLVFALRDQQNRLDNLNLARENFRQTEARIAVGTAAPLQRAEVQTEIATRESELLLASQNVAAAEIELKQLLLRDTLANEWSAAIVPTDIPSFDATPINLTDALAEARSNRPELRRLQIQKEINQIDLQYFKNQTKPQIDLVSTLSTTGLAGSTNPQFSDDRLNLGSQPRATNGETIGGYSQTLRNLFALDTRSVSVGLSIQIPLRNRTAEANLTSANIQRNQLEASTRTQEQSIEAEVRNSAQAVETARRRVLTARTARENAELQLAGERKLFEVGRSTSFLLFQRENQLANTRNQELRAEIDYNIALANLQRATSTSLRTYNVTVLTSEGP